MIVKNESAVISRCLKSVLPLIDAWTVVDTGSDDNTPQIIEGLLKHLPGELHSRPWRNFAFNRTEAFQFNRTRGDYHLVIDADDWLTFPGGYQLPELTLDSYVLPVHYSGIQFNRPQLFRSALDWRYEGVVHEFSQCSEARSVGKIDDVLYHCSSGQSSRSANPRKFHLDAELLEEALKLEPDNTRNVFYLAQSYRDAGMLEEAAENYRRRYRMEGWSEERYLSHLERSRLLGVLGRASEERVQELLQAYQLNPLRAEALVELARIYRQSHQWHLAYLFARQACELRSPDSGLFLEQAAYAWRSKDELALASYYTDRFEQSVGLNQSLLQSSDLPEKERARIEENLRFGLNRTHLQE